MFCTVLVAHLFNHMVCSTTLQNSLIEFRVHLHLSIMHICPSHTQLTLMSISIVQSHIVHERFYFWFFVLTSATTLPASSPQVLFFHFISLLGLFLFLFLLSPLLTLLLLGLWFLLILCFLGGADLALSSSSLRL